MKKFFLAIMLVVSAISQADTNTFLRPRPQPIWLEIVTQGIAPLSTPNNYSYVHLYQNGTVHGSICQEVILPTYPERKTSKCSSGVLKVLPPVEMERVRQLITRSSYTPVTGPGTDIHCAAVPTESVTIRVKTSGRLLSTGSVPCGYVQSNKSREAQELIYMMNDFENDLRSLLGF